eukprot:TRINITY_DN5317_c0_g1_i1.p2 TRINITY_DN5317_c0_g1~~TRINITY_DN5317_c0_g1_i1.p2  ORF type:complete len:196 (+),score=6.87 TRINITY_DN5317_c0_g1_i1:1444-2031(+)
MNGTGLRKASTVGSTDTAFKELVESAYQLRLGEVPEIEQDPSDLPDDMVTNTALTWFWRDETEVFASNLENLDFRLKIELNTGDGDSSASPQPIGFATVNPKAARLSIDQSSSGDSRPSLSHSQPIVQTTATLAIPKLRRPTQSKSATNLEALREIEPSSPALRSVSANPSPGRRRMKPMDTSLFLHPTLKSSPK